MRISELIKRAGVSRDTLRYYERTGVLTPPKRAANGYRDYPATALEELKFVRLAQSVGFPLAEIKRAIPHVTNPKPGCPLLRAALQEQLTAVDARIGELRTARGRLVKWLEANAAAAQAEVAPSRGGASHSKGAKRPNYSR
jgi:DNA-binding transcriptional MerR regulator